MRLFNIPEPTTPIGALSYYPTPAWFAELVVERYFPDLTTHDHLCEPGAGDGRFLDALAGRCQATGIEIQPDLAARARAKGHTVIIGDIRTVALPETLTGAIGNPPFLSSTIDTILNRLYAIFPENARAGFILPSYYFQTSNHVQTLRELWSIAVDIIPRNIYPRLAQQLCIGIFTKNAARRIVGLAFYDETNDALGIPLNQPLFDGSKPWRALVRDRLSNMGGTATLQQLYRAIEPARPSTNPWWREKVRQVVQSDPQISRVAHATYALAA